MPFDESVDPMTGNRKVHKHNAEKSKTPQSKISVEPILKDKTKGVTDAYRDIIFETFDEHTPNAFLENTSIDFDEDKWKNTDLTEPRLTDIETKIEELMKSKAKKWTEEIMNDPKIAQLFTIKPSK